MQEILMNNGDVRFSGKFLLEKFHQARVDLNTDKFGRELKKKLGQNSPARANFNHEIVCCNLD